jgi:chromate transporter
VRALARSWFAIGTQSVGGGAGTLMLIRRHIVERHRWVTPREFTEYLALSQLSPGIHLVALAGLLGNRVSGVKGIAVAVAAMMIPAAIVTTLMTAGFSAVADHPLARAGLTGMGPATGGMTIALAIILARDTRRHGRAAIVDVLVVVAALVILAFTGASSILVIVAAGALGAVALGRERPTSERIVE